MSARYSSFDIEVPPELNTPARKFRRISNPVVSCLMCLFSLLNIILLLIIFTSYSFTFDEKFSELMPTINYIITNLNSAPIIQLQPANNLKCSSGFSLQKLDIWPGTVKGCYCPQRGTLYPGSCVGLDSNTCETVSPIEAQELLAWKNDAFCVKRAQDFTRKLFGLECPAGFNDCGVYCLKQGEECPITDVVIINKDDEYDPKYTEVLKLSQDRSLLLSREKTGIPLYDIEISFYGLPCLKVDQIPVSEDNIYTLLNIPSSSVGCGIYGNDQSSHELEEITVPELLNSNNITKAQTLPLYLDQQATTKAYLISRQRFKLANTQECQDFPTSDLNILNDNIQSFKRWLVTGTVLALFVMIMHWVYLIYLFVNEGLKVFYLNATRKLVSWIVFTACFLTVVSYNRYLTEKNDQILNQKELFMKLGDANCFDNNKVSGILTTFGSQISLGTQNIMTNLSVMFWGSLTLYALAVFTFVYKKVYNLFCL